MEEKTFDLLNKTFLIGTILVVGVLVFLVGQIVLQNRMLDIQNQNQITVSGDGKIYVKPDVALISVGVTTTGATVADVAKSNTEKMNSVLEAIKKLGVDEKDIQTTNYSLTPNYEIQPQPLIYSYSYPVRSNNNIIGYTLEQNAQIKIRDFTKISDILSQTTAKGANLVGSLQFSIDNPEQYREQARAKAIAQAKSNAQNLAKESGIKLGKLINVYENYYPVYNGAVKGMGGGDMSESAPVPTIEPGQQEIDVTINLTYRVE